ncbi:MAG: flippase-like domain-containing protein, partial [Candidatus Aenigmarchaeota archaeon]|nr:flippase-like domain-containing protein [Candidatus Aenigmarchaeota archaeon]
MSNIFSIILKNMKLWLGIAILAVFLWKIDFDFSIMRTIDTAYFSIAVLLLLANVSIRVFRWDKISRTLLKKTAFLQNSKIFFLGQALNELAPQGTGEVTKAYLSYKSYGQKGRSFLVPVFERMMDIFALLIASFFVVFLLPVDFSKYGGAILFVLFAFLFASVFFMKPKYLERFAGFFIRKITKNRKDMEKNTMNW